jgi:death-on-curing protein
MRYLTIGEALELAELVTHVDAKILALTTNINSLDSAINAPQATFGSVDLYQSFSDKAAVLCCRIVWNHALVDGNKRLGWITLLMFCAINKYKLVAHPAQVIALFILIASRDAEESEVAMWIERCATLNAAF